jgi:hypothetical protein
MRIRFRVRVRVRVRVRGRGGGGGPRRGKCGVIRVPMRLRALCALTIPCTKHMGKASDSPQGNKGQIQGKDKGKGWTRTRTKTMDKRQWTAERARTREERDENRGV